MKAITICQPYAHLIVTGEKRVENRDWPTRYRGPLLIHAGKSRQWLPYGFICPADMAFGAIVGIANLAACIRSTDTEELRAHDVLDHPHTHGPWCWVLTHVRRFEHPIPWRGAQGLFDIPDEAVQS